MNSWQATISCLCSNTNGIGGPWRVNASAKNENSFSWISIFCPQITHTHVSVSIRSRASSLAGSENLKANEYSGINNENQNQPWAVIRAWNAADIADWPINSSELGHDLRVSLRLAQPNTTGRQSVYGGCGIRTVRGPAAIYGRCIYSQDVVSWLLYGIYERDLCCLWTINAPGFFLFLSRPPRGAWNVPRENFGSSVRRPRRRCSTDERCKPMRDASKSAGIRGSAPVPEGEETRPRRWPLPSPTPVCVRASSGNVILPFLFFSFFFFFFYTGVKSLAHSPCWSRVCSFVSRATSCRVFLVKWPARV